MGGGTVSFEGAEGTAMWNTVNHPIGHLGVFLFLPPSRRGGLLEGANSSGCLLEYLRCMSLRITAAARSFVNSDAIAVLQTIESWGKWAEKLQHAMSFNTNPNKWMLVNFDCSTMWSVALPIAIPSNTPISLRPLASTVNSRIKHGVLHLEWQNKTVL